MKIAIFGLGYVGCTAAACIGSQGHRVVGVDVSAAKVDAIGHGRSPIAEPQVGDMLKAIHADGRLSATMTIGSELDDTDIAIVCVGTPSGPDGSHNMSYIAQVTRQIAAAVKPDRASPLTVAYRSTMRPGSIEHIILPIFRSFLGDAADRAVELVYNPEFLREATAVDDYFHPPKIVLGTRDGGPSAAMDALHTGIDAPVFHVPFREAEITKFVDNSWHAVKVAFANEVGRVCQSLDISARQVHQIFVSDTKLNISPYYTRPGGAFGGSCLPKDVRALQHIAADVGANTHLVDSLIRTNEAHKHYQFMRLTRDLSPGARVLIVGLAFKADTDDLRESPAVDITRKLLDAGFHVQVYDPALTPEQLVGQNLGYAYAYLPTIDTLLVDKATAEAGEYDLIVSTNRLIDTLTPNSGAPVVDVSAIP
ncbi:nucleotide sugar dehydrogenase [Sphingomonas sp. Leaf343]|uniref:nucleotide sugar dehydrogenase n=1 Tax=Sphingomonas sp. Leaf343 TaxID=1736345 RepID=UPI0006FDF4AD|nr:nucleotide sugar dehydrogenase [Sphingomonas sp. Leaf343]KQR88082.1 GDP-mannose dehydrogenase [Sphingomonas sp. Leaf343]